VTQGRTETSDLIAEPVSTTEQSMAKGCIEPVDENASESEARLGYIGLGLHQLEVPEADQLLEVVGRIEGRPARMDTGCNIAGHPGYIKTYSEIARIYYWPNMGKDIRKHAKECDACQRTKPSNQPPAGRLHLLSIPERPWESRGMDNLGPVPTQQLAKT
jgi:hypothetical protein